MSPVASASLRKLDAKQRRRAAVALAEEVLVTHQDSEPADPKFDCEMVLAPEVWERMVRAARKVVRR